MFDHYKYQKVQGDPAFPPPSTRREDEYIEKMISRDKKVERLDNTIPKKENDG